MNYIPGHGNADAKLMIVGEGPTFNDKRAFQNNRELYKLLDESGISPMDCWFTTVCKYYVPPNARKGKKIPYAVRAKYAGIDLNEQLAELRTEINSISPNCILALGNTALWATTGKTAKSATKKLPDGSIIDTFNGGITDYRGSILWGPGCKVVPTYNPGQLNEYGNAEFKGYWNRVVIGIDFKRGREQAAFADLRRPNRLLEICKSSYQFKDFLARHSQHRRVAVDIESRGRCIPNCIGFAFTPQNGITIPLWNRGEIESIASIPDSEMVKLWIMIADALKKYEIVGQNFKYDQDKLVRLGFDSELRSDTMLKSYSINSELPKGLAFLTSIYTEEPFYKNEGMYEGGLGELLEGCARDCCVTREIDIALDKEIDEVDSREYYENFIHHLHDFYLDVDNEGMSVDSAKREELFHKYISWSERLAYELYTIVGEYVNTNGHAQVGRMLYDNFGIKRFQGTSEEVLTDILNSDKVKLDDNQRRAVEIVGEKRRVDKTLSTYLAALPDFDGKMRTSFFPCLDTGRSSSSQLEPPIRPTIEIINEKGKTQHKPIGIAFQTMTKHGDIGADVRAMYVPEPGHVFIQADSAQAEARVVFLLADDEEALRLIDAHDYHALTASWFFGGTEEDYSKRSLGFEHPVRFVGKTLRHAGHLGAGAKRAAATVNTDARKFKVNIKIDERFAQEALDKFHVQQPSIRGRFHAGVTEALSAGRRILHAGVPFGINSKFGGRRQFFERWGDELFRQAFSYIPQRSVSDNTKAAGLRIKKREPRLARLIIEAHDALVFMIPEKEVDYFSAILMEEMERPIRFDTCELSRRDLVIPCEVEVGYNYKDLKKVKVNASHALTA